MWSMHLFSVAWHETDRLPTTMSKCIRFYAKVVVMTEVVPSHGLRTQCSTVIHSKIRRGTNVLRLMSESEREGG